jgi:hypothetical protein
MIEMVRCTWPSAIACGAGLFGFSLAASAGTPGGLEPAQCGGFSAVDAEAVMGVPAGQWTRRVEQIHGSLWSCSFATKDGAKQVVFSIEVAKSPAEAAADMERYRHHLRDNYSDLMGLGDEGIWTEVNHTVTYRKRNVTIQVQQPGDKMLQLKVVKAIFDRN